MEMVAFAIILGMGVFLLALGVGIAIARQKEAGSRDNWHNAPGDKRKLPQ